MAAFPPSETTTDTTGCRITVTFTDYTDYTADTATTIAALSNLAREVRETVDQLLSALEQRRQQLKAWTRSALVGARVELRGPASPESLERRLGITRRASRLPVRPLFKTRVCAGSSRYRALVN